MQLNNLKKYLKLFSYFIIYQFDIIKFTINILKPKKRGNRGRTCGVT